MVSPEEFEALKRRVSDLEHVITEFGKSYQELSKTMRTR